MRMLFLVVAVLATPWVQAAGTSDALVLYSHFESRSFSETTSIESILHDFRGDIRSGERAFTFNRLEVGVQFGNFLLGYSQRYDYFLRFSNDVARLYHASSHDQLQPSSQPSNLDLHASHIRAGGPRLGIQLQPLQDVRVTLAATHLTADHMVDGSAWGQMALTAEDEYSGTLFFNLHSSEDLLLEMPVPAPEGTGYAMDARVDWAISRRWQASLEITDAYSRIEWDDVLFSDLRATSATVTFDADGRLHTEPAIAGYQYLERVTQRLPVKYQGHLQFQPFARHALYLQQFYVPSYVTQTTLGYLYLLDDSTQLGGYWNTATRGVGIICRFAGVTLLAGTDHLDGREARAWDLSLGFQLPLSW